MRELSLSTNCAFLIFLKFWLRPKRQDLVDLMVTTVLELDRLEL